MIHELTLLLSEDQAAALTDKTKGAIYIGARIQKGTQVKSIWGRSASEHHVG